MSKAKKLGGIAGLAVAITTVVAVAATGLGLKLPAQPGSPITEGVVLGQGFDPDANTWFLYIADCGGPLDTDTMGDPLVPMNFLPQCHDGTRIDVTPQIWSNYDLGMDYPL